MSDSKEKHSYLENYFKKTAKGIVSVQWKNEKDPKGSDTLATREFESNHTCYSIIFFFISNVFLLIRNRLITELHVIRDYWALTSLWFKIVTVI